MYASTASSPGEQTIILSHPNVCRGRELAAAGDSKQA